jgi:hypothetical protein
LYPILCRFSGYGSKVILSGFKALHFSVESSGEDSDENINATSSKLTDEWQFPTDGNWDAIISGAPISPIIVNGTEVTKNAYARVTITLESGNPYSVDAGSYKGILLLRDGSNISATYLVKLGKDSRYDNNSLTREQFESLVGIGCLFIPVSGYCYDTTSKPYLRWSSQEYGLYWSSTHKDSQYYYLNFSDSKMTFKPTSSDSYKDYRVVKLVKPL